MAGFCILLILGTVVWFVIWWSSESEKHKGLVAEENRELSQAIDNWSRRVQSLGINTSAPLVWRPFSNKPNDHYALHIWKGYNDTMCLFYAKPVMETRRFDAFLYPERLNIMSNGVPVACYREGSAGTRYEKDYSSAQAKMELSKYQSGLRGLMTVIDARDDAKYAPVRKIDYDTRKTIVRFQNGSTIEFRIDAYETIIGLFPHLAY